MALTPCATTTWKRAALAAALLFLLPQPVPASAAAPPPRSTDDPGQATPLDIVILVDESGSLSEADIEEETRAASTIAQSVLNPGSRVTVVGFGSNNGRPGQIAAREVCRPTLLDEGSGRQYLADCVSGLRRRDDSEGNDTDHAAALGSALHYLEDSRAPEGAVGLVFLLTDGALDVRDSPHWGARPEDRDANATARIEEHLATSRENDVRIWPLGFGDAIDRDQLDAFAAGGSQETCNDLEVATPTARVVGDSADVVRSLREALAAASCSVAGEPDSDTLSGGGETTLSTTIPPIVTDGAIVVTKNNPAISVEYVDPEGDPVDPDSGEHKGSRTTLSGANGPVEVLHMVGPLPGTWRVRLTSPDGTPEELVTATVQWQGRVNTFLTVEPADHSGEELVVRVDIRTHRGPITDPEALAELDFSAEAAPADGSADAEPVALADDGGDPDITAQDGQYAGTVTVPAGVDTLLFTSRVQGPGVPDDVRELPYTVDPGGAALQPSVRFEDPPGEVWAGSEVGGTLSVDNQGAEEEHVRLLLQAPEGVLATIEQDTTAFGPGSGRTDFTVRFDEDSTLGRAVLHVQAANAGGTVLNTSAPLTVTVRTPPGILERYWWAWSALLLAAAAATFYAWLLWRSRRAARDVRGLVVTLHRDGNTLSPGLRAPSRWSTSFAFTVRDAQGPAPRLEHARASDAGGVHRASRGPSGGVRLRTPRDPVQTLRLGEHSAPLAGDLTVSFGDERSARTAARRVPDPARATPGRETRDENPPHSGIRID
ncbi:vWA domain-containing protein [Nocardiopsis halotolerans]|uniref:vWA domain-containing protein n=1 Tax=Nocardiopsis halotolerans TaxID=124252 RepID=UPI000347E0BD|nr:vWA domain-containing protein [Nocardiopsis halotolerans]